MGDTDSWDCGMVEFFIEGGLRPRIWQVEINPIYPPPVRYVYFGEVMENYKYPPRGAERSNGCSLAYLSDLLRPNRYTLVQLDWNNAMYFRSDVVAAFGAAPLDDFAAYFHGWAGRPGLELVLEWATWATDPIVQAWRRDFRMHAS